SLTNYWGLAGNAIDGVGNDDGTLTGTTPVAGDFGQALSFDETSDRVTLPDVTYGAERTISFEFKVDDNTGSLFQYIYSHGDINGFNSVNVFLNEASHGTDPNMLRTVIRDGDDTLDNAALQHNIASLVGDGLWHTYTVTAGADGLVVYLDGVQVAADATRGTGAVDPTGSLYLGARYDLDSARLYGGSLDTVQLYDRALIATEVADLANQTNVATVSMTVTACLDADSDGVGDCHEDANTDADNDPSTNPGPDTDGDTTPDYLDADDDGDGTPTASENADPNGDTDPRDARDTDRDGQPDYLDAPTSPTVGWVAAEQKISDTEGGFDGVLDGDDRFGVATTAIGDLDGDGVVDLAVGVEKDDDGAGPSGAVYILFLNADGTVKDEQKISATEGGLTAPLVYGDRFGWEVEGLGDLDGDGTPDLAVGSWSSNDGGAGTGSVDILFLNSDGTVRANQRISALAGNLTATLDPSDRFGTGLAGLGDLDG
ncbi:MAG: LamG-like jellyroll fold domain-containing protein, partial [Actinomycetota bacterium]